MSDKEASCMLLRYTDEFSNIYLKEPYDFLRLAIFDLHQLGLSYKISYNKKANNPEITSLKRQHISLSRMNSKQKN